MDERKLQEKEKKQEIDFGKIVKVRIVDEKRKWSKMRKKVRTVDEKGKWLKTREKVKRGNGEPEI